MQIEYSANELITLGDQVKSLEKIHEELLDPNLYTFLRVDGHCFHTFTKGFKKPCDERIMESMLLAAEDWIKEFNGLTVYVQSDEATILLPPVTSDKSVLLFNGRIRKLETLSASYFSVRFNYHLSKMANLSDNDQKVIAKMQRHLVIFDCRAFQATKDLVYKVFKWRALDAYRNGTLGIARTVYSYQQLQKANVRRKAEMIREKGIDISTFPCYLLYGKWIKKILVQKYSVDRKTGKEVTVYRTRTIRRHKSFKNCVPDKMLEWITAKYG